MTRPVGDQRWAFDLNYTNKDKITKLLQCTMYKHNVNTCVSDCKTALCTYHVLISSEINKMHTCSERSATFAMHPLNPEGTPRYIRTMPAIT